MTRIFQAGLAALAITLVLCSQSGAAPTAGPASAAQAQAAPPPAPAAPGAPGPKAGAADRLVTLDAKGLPMREIIARIREQTGYTLVVEEGLLNAPITLRLNRMGLEAAARRLAGKLSLTNYALVVDETARTLTLQPIGAKKLTPAPLADDGAVVKQPVVDFDPLDAEVIPPGPGQKRGMTQREFDAARDASLQNIDPLDIEVVPPGPGQERGMTQRELDAARDASLQNIDPLDIEVVPPGPGQERGMTQRELDAARDASLQNVDPLDIEVVPPGPGQKRGMTQRELDAARDASMQNAPLSESDLLPPASGQ